MDFSKLIREKALARQLNKCGNCGTLLDKETSKFARAIKPNGPKTLKNCVIVCNSCNIKVSKELSEQPNEAHLYEWLTGHLWAIPNTPIVQKVKIPPPWTIKQINKRQNKELSITKSNEEFFKILRSWFIVKQIVRNWYNRYGRKESGFWGDWFHENYTLELTRRSKVVDIEQLYKNFIKTYNSFNKYNTREIVTNPYWPKKTTQQYLMYKSELKSRDSTSLHFNMDYVRYKKHWRGFVEPPIEAQKYLKSGFFGVVPIVSNNDLRKKIKSLKEQLKSKGYEFSESDN